ncbi:hypothetical protein Enr8_44310 [Blastopirellula retiformator]|uniref:Outer membrane efflux protein n=2 Tax=Blastopirellula retiformator TaxID=2527970 RepID=A0A5C5UZI1_9BACT|nr:hypothetical protein Enr8_44310 [Blastopirellula retiformator]
MIRSVVIAMLTLLPSLVGAEESQVGLSLQTPQLGDGQARALLKQYHNFALETFRGACADWLQCGASFDRVQANVDRIFDARADLMDPQASRVDLLREKLEWAKLLERQAVNIDQQPAIEYRVQVEFELKRAIGKPEAKTGLTLAPLFQQINSTATR